MNDVNTRAVCNNSDNTVCNGQSWPKALRRSHSVLIASHAPARIRNSAPLRLAGEAWSLPLRMKVTKKRRRKKLCGDTIRVEQRPRKAGKFFVTNSS